MNPQDLFDQLFKFKTGQDVRHKGDSKSHSADLGLLILHRLIYESVDDNGDHKYERYYVCRMIRFSGSGETAQFRETELLSIQEYEMEVLHREDDRNHMRAEMRSAQNEIHALFKVTSGTLLYLKNELGEVDKLKKYRVSGWSKGDGRPTISVTEVLESLDQKVSSESIKLDDPSKFELVNKEEVR